MLRKKLKLEESSQLDVDASNGKEEGSDQAQMVVKFEKLFWEKIWENSNNLGKELMEINYKSSDKNIAAIYNPLEYAADLHCNYLRKYLKKSPEVLFLGKLALNKTN